MKIQAIYKLYPEAVTIDDGVGVYDKDGNAIEVDEEAIAEETQKMVQANQYKYDRASAYPSIQDQLDMIYHYGIEHWKSVIEKVKNQYPKP